MKRRLTTKHRRGHKPDGVVVITGASSGIGRATATAFAQHGAKLVLAARSRESLEEVAVECAEQGAETLVVPTDVGDEAQVQDLAAAAHRRFGRIDVWVGNAGVFSFGRFEDTPSEVFEQVIRTNLLGQANGARAVLPYFRAQRSGSLIIVASLYSRITSPYVSPYVTSKFGLLGLSKVLREEVRDMAAIKVCTVMPATMDTPIYQHSANFTGHNVHPLPPVADPRRVADTIVSLVERPRREVTVGLVQRGASCVEKLLPGTYEQLVGPFMRIFAIRRGRVEPHAGNLFEPEPSLNRVLGGWRLFRRRLRRAKG